MNLNKSLLAIVAVSALSVAQAAVVVGTDTVTTFSGTFSGITAGSGANNSAATTAPFAGVSGFNFNLNAQDTGTTYAFVLDGEGLGQETITVADYDLLDPTVTGTSVNRSGNFAVTGYNVSYTYTFGTVTDYFTDGGFSGTFNFTATPVPEPSEFAAIAGAGLIGFAAWRRSRKTLA